MKLFTAREVAKLLHVRIETVYRYARRGRLPVVRVGGTWRFPEDQLREWLRNGGNGAARSSRPKLEPQADPILAVLGLGADGRLAKGIDRTLYGRAR